MEFCWRIVLLQLLAGIWAQSGDGDVDLEPRTSCWSHIATDGNSLSCSLLGGSGEDDEDEGDGIEKMSLCYIDCSGPAGRRTRCVEGSGDTIRFRETPVVNFNLTVHLRRGGKIRTTINLKKIVKPKRPQVWNVTFSPESNQAVIHVSTPYHKDYLKVDNQLFQLHIWSTGSDMMQNMSSENHMRIDMEHLQKNREYHVAVRAIPVKFLRGSWSEWSETFSFFIPGETEEGHELVYKLSVCLVPLALLLLGVVFFWKNKIFTYMWPNIPHPRATLVQICQPNKGLLLNFNPEVFSALKVYPTDEAPPSVDPTADGAQPDDPCSTQSSDCRSTTSASTEELELSALLSRSSSDGEDGLRSTSPSQADVLQLADGPHAPQPEDGRGGGGEAEVLGAGQREEAYVTMSSFYQIK